jgi:hypothetical protein
MTTTTNLGLTKPTVGGSTNTWGGLINDNLDAVDALFASAGNGTSVGLNIGSGKTLTVAGTATISGTLTVPDNSIALGTKTTGNYVASLVAGTGISVGAAAEGGTPTITNTAPDQTVSLTAGSNVTISGSYPNFTIASTASLSQDQRFSGSDVYVGNNDVFLHFEDNSSTFGGSEAMLFQVGSSATDMAVNTSGNLFIAGTLTQNYSFSDERLKTDINEITSSESLEKIIGLSPVNFKWLNPREEWVDKTQIGLIAQSVESIIPEVVREDYRLGSTGKYKIVQYENLIPLLIGAIKELKAKVDALENA